MFINQKNYRVLTISSVFPRFFKDGSEFHAMFWHNFSIFPTPGSATAKKLQAKIHYKITLWKQKGFLKGRIPCYVSALFKKKISIGPTSQLQAKITLQKQEVLLLVKKISCTGDHNLSSEYIYDSLTLNKNTKPSIKPDPINNGFSLFLIAAWLQSGDPLEPHLITRK